MKTVKTQIITQATAKLNEEVNEELEIEDPEIEVAEAILKKAKDESTP
jgi:hypothetical protein